MEFISEIIRRDSFVIEHGSHVRDAIIIVLEGQFTCSIDGTQHTVSAPEIFAFSRDTLFSRSVLQPLTCVYLQFEAFPIPLRSGFLHSSDPQRTKNTIVHLTRAVEEQNRELTEHFLRDILLLHSKQQNIPTSSDPIVSACIAYFNRHIDEHIDLEMLSKKFSISKQGLIRKFKSRTHKTPMEYLFMLRVNQSKLLLRDGSLSVSEIATKCGFENVYYFSNCFKRSEGISPSAYRKLNAL